MIEWSMIQILEVVAIFEIILIDNDVVSFGQIEVAKCASPRVLRPIDG